MSRIFSRSSVRGFLVLLFVCTSGVAQCGAAWSTQFANPVAYYATSMVAHDDGSGPSLFFGFNFTPGPPAFAPYGVVRWRGPGTHLEKVGGHSPLENKVNAMALFDDGTGPALYATGGFVTAGATPIIRIAKWNGSVWVPLGQGLNAEGHALAVYDDGNGPALYVGGKFSAAGGVLCDGLARWNGSSWSAVATSISPTIAPWPAKNVDSLAVYDPGTGPRLYAAGLFSAVNGVAANYIASFDGVAWAPLAAGVWPVNNSMPPIRELHVHDDGSGAKLYVGGTFGAVNDTPATTGLARWNGTSWTLITAIPAGYVNTLATWNSPTGSKLVVGGQFGHIQLWNGVSWSAENTFGHAAYVAKPFDFGAGEKLYVLGTVSKTTSTGGIQTVSDMFQEYDGQNWSTPTGQGLPDAYQTNSPVKVMAGHDDGTGYKLYAAGNIMAADGDPTSNVVRWDGTRWSPVSAGVPVPYAMTSLTNGPNSGLYVGGESYSPSPYAAYVHKWDGNTWSYIGSPFTGSIFTLTPVDFGGGESLVAGGAFLSVGLGGPQVNGIAYWTGSAWVPFGSGMWGPNGAAVYTTAVYDDGTGPALYAAGTFTHAGGVPANSIAKWTGTGWAPLGSGIVGGIVLELDVYDDGTGPGLYAAGNFTYAGGAPAAAIARWNGTSWSSVGDGVYGGGNYALSLEKFDDGTGLKLFVGGNFWMAGTTPAAKFAMWDGSTWSQAYGGVSFLPNDQNTPQSAVEVQNLLSFDDGTGSPTLFVAGKFNHAGDTDSYNMAALVSSRPHLTLSQLAGPGSGLAIWNSNLTVGSEYFNIFSMESAPLGPGTGPYLGLHATNIAPLVAQIVLPVGAVPFHFVATDPTASFGPFQAPVGLAIEAVCFDFSGGAIGCVSSVPHFVVK